MHIVRALGSHACPSRMRKDASNAWVLLVEPGQRRACRPLVGLLCLCSRKLLTDAEPSILFLIYNRSSVGYVCISLVRVATKVRCFISMLALSWFLLILLIELALLRSPSLLQAFSYLFFILLIALFARLSVLQVASASLLVLPFVGIFSLLIYLTGDASRAWAILAKSYLSALTVLVCMAVTPLPDLVSAAAFFKFPRLLLGITQIIHR